MSEEYSRAMPRLYGAPAYTPPRRIVEPQRPWDPDDQPLEAHGSRAVQLADLEAPANAIDDGGQQASEPSFLSRAVVPFGQANRPSSEA